MGRLPSRLPNRSIAPTGTILDEDDRMGLFDVTLPTSYNSTTGIAVDLTASFEREIKDVIVARGSWGGVLFEVTSAGDNTFAARKCVLRAFRTTATGTLSSTSGGTPSGTNTAPTFTGSALGTHGHVFTGDALSTHTHTYDKTNTPTNTTAALTNAGGADPHSHVLTFTSTASGATAAGTPTGTNALTSAGTPAGTVSAPTFTGDALATHTHTLTGTSNALAEVANTTNLQTATGFTTIRLLAVGQ